MQGPAQHDVSTSARPASGGIQRTAVGACLLLALWLVLGTAGTIWRFGFSELHADQFIQYRTLLENTFLTGLVQPANAHRHVISNIVRWLDIALFDSDQTAGIVAGLVIWLAAWVIVTRQVWQATANAPQARAAAVLLSGLALAWLGSARVQLHGNEAPQVYFVVCCALLAMACIADRERTSLAHWLLALALGVLGMLSFGSGVAIFGGLLALAVVLRHPPLHVAAAGIGAVAAVLTYSFLLPGGDGVRNSVSLEPLVVIGNAATWLGSALTTGWLVWGGEGVFGTVPARLADDGVLAAWLVASASGLRGLLGSPSTVQLAQACGAAGMLMLSGFGLAVWLRPGWLTPLGRLGLGIALFTAALAVLVAIGRSAYFVLYPDQLLADRYVMWTVLFWFGLALCAISVLAPRSPTAGWACVLLAGLLFIAAWPVHRIGGVWGEAAAQAMEKRAAQAQAGVLLPGWIEHSNLGRLEEVEEFLAFYRAREQAMFRTPRSRLLGEVLAPALLATAEDAAVLDWYPHGESVVQPEVAIDGIAWHVAGHLFAERVPGEGLVAVASDGRVVGLGEFSYDHEGAVWERIDDVARGFDLYLRTAAAGCPAVTLYRIDAAATRLQRLAPLACARQPAAAQ